MTGYKTHRLDFIKIKNFHSLKGAMKNMNGKPQCGRRYLQRLYLTMDQYLG